MASLSVRALRYLNVSRLTGTMLLAATTVTVPAFAGTYIVDTSAITISAVTLEDKCWPSASFCFVTVHDVVTSSVVLSTFNNTPFTSEQVGGVATFSFAGDLRLNADDRVIGVGDRPASFVVGNNALMDPGSSLEFGAGRALGNSILVGKPFLGSNSVLSGPGGGGGGTAGPAGLSRLGGSEGPGGPGGSGGNGGECYFLVGCVGFGGQGHGGTTGTGPPLPADYFAGNPGQPGGNGHPGFNSTAISIGGTAGQAGALTTVEQYVNYLTALPRAGGGGSDAGGGYGGEGVLGTGGSTGNNGGYATGVGPTGLPGGPGGSGERGVNSGIGASLSGGTGGAGGGGGGSGQAGTGGAGGGGGQGGGGGGAAEYFFTSGPGGKGGGGGKGGDGGAGGASGSGGYGGSGGGGGGALEILVRGKLIDAGQISAMGGGPQAGSNIGEQPRGMGTDPGPVGGGLAGETREPGGDGGPGGNGGAGVAGGDGGVGGRGGDGGGGAGGTIALIASKIAATVDAIVNVAGGHTDGVSSDGGPGRVLLGTNTVASGTAISDAFTGTVQGAQAGSTLPGTRRSNIYLSVATREETPYIPDLVGGAEGFGLLPDPVARAVAAFAQRTAPSDAKAGLMLSDRGPAAGFGDDYIGFDWLYLINVRDIDLINPVFGAGQKGYLNFLYQGGFENDPLFVSGARLQLLDVLGPFDVYATLVPDDTTDFCFAGGGVSVKCVSWSEDDPNRFLSPVFITAGIPEPPTLVLLTFGLGLIGFASRRRAHRRHQARSAQGRLAVLLTPLELIDRIAALAPLSRVHRSRYVKTCWRKRPLSGILRGDPEWPEVAECTNTT